MCERLFTIPLAEDSKDYSRGQEMKENKYLKWLLIVQSFLPLFALMIIRCYSRERKRLVFKFKAEFFRGNFKAIETAVDHPEIFGSILLCFGTVMFVFSLAVTLFFRKNQCFGFQEEGKKLSLMQM